MKRFCAVLLAMFFMIGNILATSEVLDQTLAAVNGTPIFVSEFNSVFLPILEQYKQNVPITEQTEEKVGKLKDEILNQKIEEIILKQEVKKQRIKVLKKEMQDAVDDVKKKFKSEAEFKAELKKENITIAEFEKKLTDQLANVKLIKQSVEANVKPPTEIEVKDIYDKAAARVKVKKTDISSEDDLIIANFANALKRACGEHVRLRQIFISCPKGATAVQVKSAQEKIVAVKKELQKKSFAEVAGQYSEDSDSKQRKGDLGVIAKGDLFPIINNAVFAMKVGDYNREPIKTEAGYHFFKVEEKHASRDITFDDVKNDIAGVLYQNKARKAYAEYINDLKSKANIKINKIW
ncbi:MAG: peptidylprolyl isomerase [Endomicrobium sp.]|jgi:parvulin-like peptidyl-prolyl isomerase|nr:peptidylprolyl isomerase [Endomicrobium sp.]